MFEDFFGVPRGETPEEKKDRYKKMEIGADPKFIDAHCGQYPDVQSPDVEGFHRDLFKRLDKLLRRFPEIRKKVDASEEELSHLQAVLNREWTLMETDITYCTRILESLVEFLNAHHGRKCILLIDELDAPILAASEDNRDTIKGHIRKMLAPVVKTTEDLLSKCIMVGVNPISLGELGSGLNNVTSLPLHYASEALYPKDILKREDLPYQIAFGFTEDEVRKLIATRVFPDNEAMVDIALKVARD
ncbi:hypothetical protein EV182_004732, partial [Spiromyces aspiralis]